MSARPKQRGVDLAAFAEAFGRFGDGMAEFNRAAAMMARIQRGLDSAVTDMYTAAGMEREAPFLDLAAVLADRGVVVDLDAIEADARLSHSPVIEQMWERYQRLRG